MRHPPSLSFLSLSLTHSLLTFSRSMSQSAECGPFQPAHSTLSIHSVKGKEEKLGSSQTVRLNRNKGRKRGKKQDRQQSRSKPYVCKLMIHDLAQCSDHTVVWLHCKQPFLGVGRLARKPFLLPIHIRPSSMALTHSHNWYTDKAGCWSERVPFLC